MKKKIIIQEYFDDLAPRRDYWKRKNSYYYDYVENFLSFLVAPNKSVLEVGCGTGDLLFKLNPKRGLGIDISSKMLEIANIKYKKKGLEFRMADIKDINEEFDFVVMSDVVGYMEDVQNVFLKLHQVTHPGTRIIITQYSQLWEPVLGLASRLKLRMPSSIQNWLSADDIENLLYLSGFEVVKRGSKLLLPKYIPLLSSLCNRFLVNLWPFNNFALINYLVARPSPTPNKIPASVSIVVPARNEAGMIKKIVDELPDLGSKTEVILVEGHSKDNTRQEIKEVLKSYRGNKRLRFTVQDGIGKGDAVRKGFDMADGDILMIYDADVTVPPEELEKFYDALTAGKGEFINGCRLVYPMEKQSMNILNYAGNKFFSFMFSWLLGQKIKDTLCGTKVFWKKDYEDIKRGRRFFGNFDPFGDFDLLFGAAKLNLKIVDLPVHYKERVYGMTNISRWRHGWLLLKMTLFAMKKIKFI
jgi:ubiquinone/menaquinone biosynthesis C-methylase UbiE